MNLWFQILIDCPEAEHDTNLLIELYKNIGNCSTAPEVGEKVICTNTAIEMTIQSRKFMAQYEHAGFEYDLGTYTADNKTNLKETVWQFLKCDWETHYDISDIIKKK